MDTKTFAIVSALATICVTIISIFAIIHKTSWAMTGIIVGTICATITVIIPLTQNISLRLKRKKKDDSTEVDVGIESRDINISEKLHADYKSVGENKTQDAESALPVRNVIYLDLSEFKFGVRELPIEKYKIFNDLLSAIYINYLFKHISSFSYGRQWFLKDSKTDEELKKKGRNDNRSLKELGIYPGIHLKATTVRPTKLRVT